MNDLVIGVLAGLLASLLLVILQRVWSRYLMPTFDKSIEIEGAWITDIVYPDGQKNRHRITLHRLGRSIWGTAVCEEGWGRGLKYKLTGTFNNLVLTSQYAAMERRRLERGSFTLMLVDGGAKLRGHLSYLDNESHTIAAVPCEWRAEEMPNPAA